MKIALLGAGHIGETIARLLHGSGHYDVTVFDNNAAALSVLAGEGIKTQVIAEIGAGAAATVKGFN
ncbi:MAG: NAD-binding protein, partial [Paucibacter sp.]|nr:NAD-binding protein [Roseateles sp.]